MTVPHKMLAHQTNNNIISAGEIEPKEMVDIIETLYEMEGVGKEPAEGRAMKIFSDLDINCDGSVTEEEFIRGCLLDDEFVRLLNAGGVDPDEYDDD